MRISKQRVKEEFINAEEELNDCWDVLIKLKYPGKDTYEIGEKVILFQEKLASLILRLNKFRAKLISERKNTIKNKDNYNNKWFISRLQLLDTYKKGIDSIVNIGKALGDAYVYFFYRNDLQMLEEHLSHQRIINSSSGIGEIGEVEFLKKFKHIDGHLTLYHGITNVLRYGDYSFVDLSVQRVVQIGELKTKRVGENEIEFNLTLLRKMRVKEEEIKDVNISITLDEQNNRNERQIDGIAKFLNDSGKTTDFNYTLLDESYFSEIEKLYNSTKINNVLCVKVSDGLAFSLFKFKNANLFNKVYRKKYVSIVDKVSVGVVETAKKLLSAQSQENSIILGQILYNPDLSDKNTPGTTPFFWYPFNQTLLKKLYFLELNIISIFNPIHLITDIEKLGFIVESKYINNSKDRVSEKNHVVKRFDIFISYVINFLMTEKFVFNGLVEVLNNKEELEGKNVVLKPQIDMFGIKDPN